MLFWFRTVGLSISTTHPIWNLWTFGVCMLTCVDWKRPWTQIIFTINKIQKDIGIVNQLYNLKTIAKLIQLASKSTPSVKIFLRWIQINTLSEFIFKNWYIFLDRGCKCTSLSTRIIPLLSLSKLRMSPSLNRVSAHQCMVPVHTSVPRTVHRINEHSWYSISAHHDKNLCRYPRSMVSQAKTIGFVFLMDGWLTDTISMHI